MTDLWRPRVNIVSYVSVKVPALIGMARYFWHVVTTPSEETSWWGMTDMSWPTHSPIFNVKPAGQMHGHVTGLQTFVWLNC